MAIPKRSPAQESKEVAQGTPREKKGAPTRGRRMLRTVGLGLITGAADDDPTTTHAGFSIQHSSTIGLVITWFI